MVQEISLDCLGKVGKNPFKRLEHGLYVGWKSVYQTI